MNKAFRLKAKENNGKRNYTIYSIASSESEAKHNFNENFGRFNTLLSVKEITKTAKGRKLLGIEQ